MEFAYCNDRYSKSRFSLLYLKRELREYRSTGVPLADNAPALLKLNTNFTMIVNPGTTKMEIVEKKGEKLEHYRVTTEKWAGKGSVWAPRLNLRMAKSFIFRKRLPARMARTKMNNSRQLKKVARFPR